MMASFSASSRSRTLARVTGAAGITTLVVVLGTSLATDVVTSANTSVGDTTGPPCRRTSQSSAAQEGTAMTKPTPTRPFASHPLPRTSRRPRPLSGSARSAPSPRWSWWWAAR